MSHVLSSRLVVALVVASGLLPATSSFAQQASPSSAAGIPATVAPWPSLATAPPHLAADGGNDAALIVGVEKYAYLAGVPGAAKNVSDWEAYLHARGVPSVFVMRDNEATAEAIRDMAKEAAAAVKPGGTLWFVFIGHGASRPADTSVTPPVPADGVLIATDAQQSARIYQRAVTRTEIAQVLLATPQSPSARVVMILDSCFSGRAPDGKPLVDGLQPTIPPTAIDAMLEGAKDRLTVLSAGKSDEFAGPLPKGDRPAFSYLTLGGLRGWADANKDGAVTSKELVSYAASVLRHESTRHQNPETVGPDAPLEQGASEPPPDIDQLLDAQPIASGPPPKYYVESRPVPSSFWVGAWVTVALGAGAIVTGVLALGKKHDFDSANDGSNPSGAQDLQSQTKTLNLVTDGLIGGAIVAGALSTYFLVARPTERKEVARVHLAPLVGYGTAGLTLGGLF